MYRSSIVLFIAAVSTTALTHVALAADLPVKAPPPSPPPAPVYMWTGFYVGLNAGYGWGTSNDATTTTASLADGPAQFFSSGSVVVTDPSSQLVAGSTALANAGTASVKQKGFIGGGQIGYNLQLGSNVVVGIEADIQGSDIHGGGSNSGSSTDSFAARGFTFSKSAIGPNFAESLTAAWGNPVFNRSAFGTDDISARVDWLGTVRARAGYLITPNFLIYATGGLAYGAVKASGNYSFETDYSFSADSFALAYGQASWPGALATVSATAVSNNATASATGATQNLNIHSTVLVAPGTANSSLSATNTGPGPTSGTAFLATSATPAASTATVSGNFSTQGTQTVLNFTHATTPAPSVATTTNAQTVAHFSDTKFGGTIGGGFEWKFAPNWSIKTEGLYYNLGSVTFTAPPLTSSVNIVQPTLPTGSQFATATNAINKFVGTTTNGNTPTTRVRFDGFIVRVGINYQFNLL
jgi:opacity protein-like surface antigen